MIAYFALFGPKKSLVTCKYLAVSERINASSTRSADLNGKLNDCKISLDFEVLLVYIFSSKNSVNFDVESQNGIRECEKVGQFSRHVFSNRVVSDEQK